MGDPILVALLFGLAFGAAFGTWLVLLFMDGRRLRRRRGRGQAFWLRRPR